MNEYNFIIEFSKAWWGVTYWFSAEYFRRNVAGLIPAAFEHLVVIALMENL